jgi:3-hydroxyisobutyrate dehydrogenase-like beta-hydroxyacid dehydrogenase
VTDIGFIGLGTMGSAMATRLVGAGHRVHVWNRSAQPVDDLVAAGAVRAADPAAALATGLCFSMLANDAAAASIFTAELLAGAPDGAIHVNMATVGLTTADELAELHASNGVDYVAAPVLGRPAVAEAGQLNIVASGRRDTIDRLEPFFSAMGKQTWVVGGQARDANLVKLAVNFNLIHAIQALSESLALIEAGGVDASMFVSILTDVAFSGSAYTGYGNLIATKDYRPAFPVSLGSKDLALVEQAARLHGLELPSVPTLRLVFDTALGDPALKDLDWSVIAEITRSQVLSRG